MDETDRVIGERYRVRAQLGAGAMGVVWRADDERLGRVVALKQVSLRAAGPEPDAAAREQAHRRVIREGRMIARLHHPNAIAVYDVVDHDDEPWLVMEYLESASLAGTLADVGSLPPGQVARLGGQVAAALAAAHEAGIVHRDVKPGNVLLGDEGLTKVTDFGIARAVDEATLTSSGMMAGTPAYLAPEVARGGTADFRSDVFGLGSTLYAAVEGAPPFGTGDNPLALLHRVASGDHPPPRRAGPLGPLLAGLLDRDPDRRPPMSDAREELARLAAAEAETGTGPLPPLVPPAISTRSSPPARPPVPTPPPPEPRRQPPTPMPGPPQTGTPGGSAVAAPDTTRPAVTRPVDPTSDGAAPSPRRRRGLLLVAAGIVAVTLVAVVTVLLVGGVQRFGTAGSDPSPSTGTAASGDGGGSGSGGSGSGGTGSGGTDGAAPSVRGTDPGQRAQQQAVIDYYGLLPDRLDEGWQRLTPSYQRTTVGGLDSYRGFWSAIGTVRLGDVAPAAGDAVDASVSYGYRDGRTVVERTRFRMVGQGDAWKIDGTTVLSSR